MTESMIERVAKALCVQSGIIWEKQSDTQRGHNMSLARAAIEAMREPTERMIKSGNEHCDNDGNLDAAYRAMIDAALIWPAGSADIAGVPLARD